MTRGERSGGRALVALGSNLPWRGLQPSAILLLALEKLGALGTVEARSGWWRTEAWPDPGDPPFWNMVARLRADLDPVDLLARMLAIETELGRERSAPNAPRTLDLDLLDYDGRILDEPARPGRPRLQLPHPRIAERAFVLLPLLDVAPGWRDPASGASAAELVERLTPEQRRTAWRASPGDSP